MVGTLIPIWLEAKMHRRGEHARMLARAIIVDRARTLACAQELARRILADWPVRAAGEIALVETGLGEQASHRLDMLSVAAVRGASDRKLVLAKRERVRRSAFDQRQRLHRLDR